MGCAYVGHGARTHTKMTKASVNTCPAASACGRVAHVHEGAAERINTHEDASKGC